MINTKLLYCLSQYCHSQGIQTAWTDFVGVSFGMTNWRLKLYFFIEQNAFISSSYFFVESMNL